MEKCKCHSYNGSNGEKATESEVIMTPYYGDGEMKQVAIDYCISNTMQVLWNKGIMTLGCCCGHGTKLPSIVFASCEDAIKGRDLIGKIDKRYFECSYWGRVIL